MKKLASTIFLVSMAICSQANAAKAWVSGTIVETVYTADNGLWGSCMVQLTPNISSAGLNCATWATLDCTGQFHTKADAFKMFDQTNMAFALNKTVRFLINDAKTINNRCLVETVVIQKG